MTVEKPVGLDQDRHWAGVSGHKYSETFADIGVSQAAFAAMSKLQRPVKCAASGNPRERYFFAGGCGVTTSPASDHLALPGSASLSRTHTRTYWPFFSAPSRVRQATLPTA